MAFTERLPPTHPRARPTRTGRRVEDLTLPDLTWPRLTPPGASALGKLHALGAESRRPHPHFAAVAPTLAAVAPTLAAVAPTLPTDAIVCSTTLPCASAPHFGPGPCQTSRVPSSAQRQSDQIPQQPSAAFPRPSRLDSMTVPLQHQFVPSPLTHSHTHYHASTGHTERRSIECSASTQRHTGYGGRRTPAGAERPWRLG